MDTRSAHEHDAWNWLTYPAPHAAAEKLDISVGISPDDVPDADVRAFLNIAAREAFSRDALRRRGEWCAHLGLGTFYRSTPMAVHAGLLSYDDWCERVQELSHDYDTHEAIAEQCKLQILRDFAAGDYEAIGDYLDPDVRIEFRVIMKGIGVSTRIDKTTVN